MNVCNMLSFRLISEVLIVIERRCHFKTLHFTSSACRPDITVMVDWALKINYLSIYLAQLPAERVLLRAAGDLSLSLWQLQVLCLLTGLLYLLGLYLPGSFNFIFPNVCNPQRWDVC